MCLISGNDISVDAREGVSLALGMDKMCEINHESEKLYSIVSDIRGRAVSTLTQDQGIVPMIHLCQDIHGGG
jgi:hypothetical protein